MSMADEQKISEYLSNFYKIEFENYNYKLQNWGKVDNFSKINDNVYLFLEVESNQKHPCTNVLKLWPYLEEHKNITIILLQYYLKDSHGKNSNRGRLSTWLGEKLQKELQNRFFYFRNIFDEKNIANENQIKLLINKLSK